MPVKHISKTPTLPKQPCNKAEVAKKMLEIFLEYKRSYTAESVFPAMEYAVSILKDL
jgi:hypothetical protein